MSPIPRTFVSALIGIAGSALAANPTFIALPQLPDARLTTVRALSQDGRLAAGDYSTGPSNRGFRYSFDTGVVEPLLGNPMRPDAPSTTVSGMSSDGSYLSGRAVGPAGGAGARIRPGQAPDFIAPMPGDFYAEATSISGDGRIVVGRSHGDNIDVISEPFRWTPEGGTQSLGSLSAVRSGGALDISRDGTTIVGYSANGGLQYKPFVWTEARGMVGLPTVGGTLDESAQASAVSADGSVIFGTDSYVSVPRSGFVRWDGGVLEELPIPENTYHPYPADTSDTGGITVGRLYHQGVGDRGFVWTEAMGIVFAEDYLAMHGVTVPSGPRILSIQCVSGDGQTFGGILSDGRGFIAAIPAAPSGVVLAVGVWVWGVVGSRRRRS